MKQLTVELTDEQYNRFKAAMQSMAGEGVITDDNLIAQMKREAAAITYAVENGNNVDGWQF